MLANKSHLRILLHRLGTSKHSSTLKHASSMASSQQSRRHILTVRVHVQAGPDQDERWPRGADLDARDERRDKMQAFQGGILRHLKIGKHSSRSSSEKGSPAKGAEPEAPVQAQSASGYAGDSEGGWGDRKEADTPKESAAFVYPEVCLLASRSCLTERCGALALPEI